MAATFAYLLTILVALLHFTVVSADFDLYRIYGSEPIRQRARSDDIIAPGPPLATFDYGWQIFEWDIEPICDQVLQTPFYQNSKDLSHGRLGIRCQGNCGIYDGPWGNVERLEMHFTNHPNYHATIYVSDGFEQDGGWRWIMYSDTGHAVGMCFAYDNHDLDCNYLKSSAHFYIARKFRCSPNAHDITAKWINQIYLKEGGETAGNKYSGESAAEDAELGNVTAVAWTG